jgi:centromeric protein E
MDTCKDVYKDSGAAGIVEGFLQGVNGAVCAYGATNTGKTYTMAALSRFCVKDVFSHREWDLGSALGDDGFELRLSVFEVYNEQVFDLLQSGKARHKPLRLLEAARGGGVVVDKGAQVRVTSREECEAFLEQAQRARETSTLKTNSRSSRSHLVARLHLRQEREKRPGGGGTEESAEEGKTEILSSTLTLVDLAGAERAAESKAEGMQLKEAGSINQSLLAFGNVVSRLAEGGGARVHVPYRSSKLTRLLRPALDGNCGFLLVCTISPLGGFHLEQTRSTLQFGSRALDIKVAPVVNVSEPSEKQLRKHVARLQAALGENGPAGSPEAPAVGSESAPSPPEEKNPSGGGLGLKSRVGAITRRLMRRQPRVVSSHPVGLPTPHSEGPPAGRSAHDLQAAQRLSYSPHRAAAVAPMSHEVDGVESEIVRTAIKAMRQNRVEKEALTARLQSALEEGGEEADECADIISQCASDIMRVCKLEAELMEERVAMATEDEARAREDAERYQNELRAVLSELDCLSQESTKEVVRWEAELMAATAALDESGIEHQRQAFELTKAQRRAEELESRLLAGASLAKDKSQVLARQNGLIGEMEKDLEAIPALRKQKVALAQEVEDLKSQLEHSLRERQEAQKASELRDVRARSITELRDAELAEANQKVENLTKSYVEATSALAEKECEILASSEAFVEAQRAASASQGEAVRAEALTAHLHERLSVQSRQVAALRALWVRHATAAALPNEDAPPAVDEPGQLGEGAVEDDSPRSKVPSLLVRVRQLEALAAQQHALVRVELAGGATGGEAARTGDDPPPPLVRAALQDTTNVGTVADTCGRSEKGPAAETGEPGESLAALCAKQTECMAGLHEGIDEMVRELSEAVEATDGQRVLLGQIAEQNAEKVRELEEREAQVHSSLARERGKTETLKRELEQQIEATQVLREELAERSDSHESLFEELKALRCEMSEVRAEHLTQARLEEDLELLAEKGDRAEQRLRDQQQQWLHSGVLCTKVGRNSKGYCRFVRLSPDRRCLEWFHVSPVPKRIALRGGAPLEKWSSFYSVKGMDRDVRLLMRSPWELQWVAALQEHVETLPPPSAVQISRPPSPEIEMRPIGAPSSSSPKAMATNLGNGDWNDVEWTFGSPRNPVRFNPSKDLQSQKFTPRKNFRNLFREKIAGKAAGGMPPEPAFALR